MAMKDPEELKDLGIRAERQAPLDAFRQRVEENKATKKSTHLE